ncbi:hypothetical protein SAY87_019998 [Trapa incisa]|uniref:Uncharacterized protein n=1 Tax=Trapa incisa TaxID=236973 RepID=A0AAN7K385_9MYRT|nr:hypothetical protein SAY87_019998 [Trapa incisa]
MRTTVTKITSTSTTSFDRASSAISPSGSTLISSCTVETSRSAAKSVDRSRSRWTRPIRGGNGRRAAATAAREVGGVIHLQFHHSYLQAINNIFQQDIHRV